MALEGSGVSQGARNGFRQGCCGAANQRAELMTVVEKPSLRCPDVAVNEQVRHHRRESKAERAFSYSASGSFEYVTDFPDCRASSAARSLKVTRLIELGMLGSRHDMIRKLPLGYIHPM